MKKKTKSTKSLTESIFSGQPPLKLGDYPIYTGQMPGTSAPIQQTVTVISPYSTIKPTSDVVVPSFIPYTIISSGINSIAANNGNNAVYSATITGKYKAKYVTFGFWSDNLINYFKFDFRLTYPNGDDFLIFSIVNNYALNGTRSGNSVTLPLNDLELIPQMIAQSWAYYSIQSGNVFCYFHLTLEKI
jgi:hypothetical protein